MRAFITASKKTYRGAGLPYQSLLPSENTLIEEYACSRNTVRRALAELVADGYVRTMQGRGVRVIYQPVGKTTFTIGGIETFQGDRPPQPSARCDEGHEV